ncbi:MAG: hypothetical protein NT154_20640 [Verrucomicrobia bacterium]|nr:hypothetical protein [Verrucomicrobiota bacterium]
MKIQDIPQVGKLGLTVTWPARNGLVRRILVTPANPRTDRQVVVRDLLKQEARRFDALTDAQQDAWNVAADGFKSKPSLGQSDPLTGLQLFVRVNCKLGLLGQAAVDVPPLAPEFPALAPTNLVITNAGGVVAVKLTCPADPGENTVLRASPPQNSAVRACYNYRIIGVCPAPVTGTSDITALYVAEFGAVPVGKRLFVKASTMVDGFESLARQFHARVPASA